MANELHCGRIGPPEGRWVTAAAIRSVHHGDAFGREPDNGTLAPTARRELAGDRCSPPSDAGSLGRRDPADGFARRTVTRRQGGSRRPWTVGRRPWTRTHRHIPAWRRHHRSAPERLRRGHLSSELLCVPPGCLRRLPAGRRACRGRPCSGGDLCGAVPPLHYLLVGWSSLFLGAEASIYGMRLVSAVLTAVLLTWGAFRLSQLPRRHPLTWGIAVAVTPMCLFLGATVNPQGLEIAAAFSFWRPVCTLSRVGKHPRQPHWSRPQSAVPCSSMSALPRRSGHSRSSSWHSCLPPLVGGAPLCGTLLPAGSVLAPSPRASRRSPGLHFTAPS